MPRRHRIGMAFCAAIATAVTLGACGSGLPGNAVAQVGDATITRSALAHWLVIANDSSQVTTGAAAPAIPVPPDYPECVAAQQKAAGNTAASKSATEVANDKAVCAQNYQALLNEVLPYLIETIWIQGEAVDRGVHASKADVDKAFAQERASSKPPITSEADLTTFLRKSGQTVADLKWRTLINVLTNKIELKVQRTAQKVSKAQIASYFKKNRAQFTTPETRDVHLVLTASAATADKVKSLLAGGASYATIAPKYSVDATSKAKGGQMLGVTSGELTPLLSNALFAAKVGALSGPVKTAFGYYVFTVDKVTPGSAISLKTASPTIKAQLSQQQVSAAETALQTEFSKKWTARTTCRSGFEVSVCKNAPKGATGSTGTTPSG